MSKKLLTILALLLFVATGAWAQDAGTYKITLKEGTEDATNWTISPTEATENTTVTATYSGTKRVKSVTAVVKSAETVVDLSKLTKDYTAKDGDVLTNSTTKYKVTIADGAKVTLDGASISGNNFCIKCAGSATIILKDGTTNTLTSSSGDYPALWAGNAGTTLTIQGSTGALNVTSGPTIAGIGGGYKNKNSTCGDIKIEGGIITAQGGRDAAGIGSDCYAKCGNITITGGTITANGGANAAGIGSGYGANPTSCGNITITSGVTKVTATKGERAPYSIGKGLGDKAKCGTVTIGGTVYEKGISESPYTYPSTGPEGLLNGQFSVSATKKVQFSKGNLRYASGSWSFFDDQDGFYTKHLDSSWDKFGWSTSTTTFGMNTSTDNSTYSGDFVDWGKLAISNGGNTADFGWRTLTSDEWTYLFETRDATTVNSVANARFAKAKLFGSIYGVILFPDSYTHPDGVALPTGINKTDDTSWDANNYDADWAKMETAGCVFLPAAGYRLGETVNNANTIGYYWSSSPNSSGVDDAYYVYFGSGSLLPGCYDSRCIGFSVRLVYDVK